MANISEILVGQAGKAIEATKQDDNLMSNSFSQGAQLALKAEELQQQKQVFAQKQAEAKNAKWDKVGNWFETAAKMPEGAAKKAFVNDFIPNGINALGMTEEFNPTSLKMLQSDTTLASYLRDQVRTGKLTQEQLTQATRDPEYLAQLLPDASKYGSYENYKAAFENDVEGLDKAAQFAEEQRRTDERAKLNAKSSERSAAITAGKEDYKRENDLRNELTSNPVSKTTYSVNEAYGKIKDLTAGKPSPSSDMSLVFAYMKMLDPASTVREGEQAQARDAKGVPDYILDAYNQAVSGQTLNPKQRKDMAQNAKLIYDKQKERQVKLNDRYKKIAEKSGVRPDVIVTGTEFDEEQAAPAGPSKDQSAKLVSLYEKHKNDPESLKKIKAKAKELGIKLGGK